MVFVKSKERKITKYKNILARNFNIAVVNQATECIAICNGGLGNGLSQEQILQELSKFGDIEAVRQPAGHTASFLQFKNVEDAELTIQSNISLTWDGGGPAFLAFVERIPDPDRIVGSFECPSGLIVLPDFISDAEEKRFLQCISFESEALLKHRQVKHFGFEFIYSENRAGSDPIEPIPNEFNVLWTRLFEKTGFQFSPDQCTVNRYNPGDGIPPHVDTHSAFTEYIISLSMESNIVMDWRKDNNLRHVLLPRFSLCVMTEESRYGWTHAIASRKSDVIPTENSGLKVVPRSTRTSVTFRKKREGDCNCAFKKLCDTALSNLKNLPTYVPASKAADFEKTSVHEVYEKIADHFSETRHKPWPNVVKFLQSFPVGSIIIDIGCGNGKYLANGVGAAMIGCDRSGTLAQVCKQRGYSVFICDCLNVPIKDNSVDGCISIAVLHHLSTEERRLKGIREMIRVLRPGGRTLIYVWAKNQETNSVKSNYLKQKKKSVEDEKIELESSVANINEVVLPVHTNRTNFQSADMFVPWQKKPVNGDESGSTYLRYYHVFDDFELKKTCEQLENVVCNDYYYDQGNWCIILEKTK